MNSTLSPMNSRRRAAIRTLLVDHAATTAQHTATTMQRAATAAQPVPSAQQREPVARKQEPMAPQRELLAEQQELVAQQQEPLAQRQEPAAQQQEPLAQRQEPAAQQQEPLAQRQEPAAQQRQFVAPPAHLVQRVQGRLRRVVDQPAGRRGRPGADLSAPESRSRRRRRVARRIVLGSVTMAAAAVAAVVMVTADPAAPPSYASWTAVPATAPGGTVNEEDIEVWASVCTDLGVGGIGVEGVGARRQDIPWRTALVDRRGDFTYCVDIALGSGTRSDPFIALSGIRAHGLNRMWANTTDRPIRPPTGGEVVVVGGDAQPEPEPEPGVTSLRAYQLYGMAGPDVTGVDIVLGNGLRITATLQHGIWGAWWPAERGEPTGSRIEIQTVTGTRSAPTDSLRMP
jgi:hypothetical protein